jgi:hypothetical protein
MKYWAVLAALGLLAVGCAKNEDATTAPNSTTVEQKGGQTTVTLKGNGSSTSATVDQSGGAKIEHTDATGTTKLDTKAAIPDRELGIALYPGAKKQTGADKSTKLESPAGASLSVNLTTTDSAAAVVEFYKKQIKGAKVDSFGANQLIEGKNAAGNDVTISVDPTTKKGVTQIGIVVTKKK